MNVFKTPSLRNTWVGFDNLFSEMARSIDTPIGARPYNYPPYNLLKDGNKTILRFGLAGYSEKDLDLRIEDGNLILEGKIEKEESSDNSRMIYQGLAERSFKRSFRLNSNTKVNTADFVDGILRIELETLEPEKDIQKIQINSKQPFLEKKN